MKLVTVFVGVSLALSVFAGPEWGYNAPWGPSHWGNEVGYETCGTGAEQSPILIESGAIAGLRNTFPDNSLEPIRPNWSPAAIQVLNNGHTLQNVYAPGSTLEFETITYDLKQFHFHSPSEHLLDERQYPLEAHFVHATANGNLLVVGVFFKVGAENGELAKVWKNAPTTAGQTNTSPELVSAAELWPGTGEYYTYSGSLTTPPCSESVRWIVMKQPVEASPEQLRFLQQTMGGANNRPIQPLDGRLISTGDQH